MTEESQNDPKVVYSVEDGEEMPPEEVERFRAISTVDDLAAGAGGTGHSPAVQPPAAFHRKASAASIEATSQFLRVGLLTKLGGSVKNWLERGFALQKESRLLHYFRTVDDFKAFVEDPKKNVSRVAGSILLAQSRIYLAKYTEFANCIEITTSKDAGERHYYMYAKSKTDLGAWIARLTECGATFVSPTATLEELTFVTHPDAPAPVYGMQGFVDKRGGFVKGFRTRFFRIEWDTEQEEHVIAYYVRFDDTKPKGKIRLRDAKLQEAKGDDATDAELWDIETKDRTFHLRCSEREKRQWQRVLARFILNPQLPAPEIASEVEPAGGLRTLNPAELEKMAAERTRAAEAEAKAAAEVAAAAARQEEELKRASDEALLRDGSVLTKYGRRGNPKRRLVWVEGGRLCWSDGESAASRVRSDEKSILLVAIDRVVPGRGDGLFASEKLGGSDDERMCFSVVTADRSVDLVASTAAERDHWVRALVRAKQAAMRAVVGDA